VDEELGRLFTALRDRGLKDDVNILITADHGFSTHGGPFNLIALLTARGLADGVKIIGGSQIYVRTGGEEKIRRIVKVLQETTWVGAIFTRAKSPGSHEGLAPGTLSLDTIHHQHARAADILVDPSWSRTANAHGFAGSTTSGGVAGHGSSSPYDIRINLIASGPDFKQATRSSVPTANTDLALTLCQLHGVAPAPSMTGRVLGELLRSGPASSSIEVERSVQHVATKTATGVYELRLHTSRVGQTEYIDYTETTR
jgi:arylsulfatase A-like enzyme